MGLQFRSRHCLRLILTPVGICWTIHLSNYWIFEYVKNLFNYEKKKFGSRKWGFSCDDAHL
jgi:hypothetical protein